MVTLTKKAKPEGAQGIDAESNENLLN